MDPPERTSTIGASASSTPPSRSSSRPPSRVSSPRSQRGPRTPAPSAPPLDPRGDSDGCRILVVDDEPTMTRTLRRVLRAEGYLVDCASDGEEAKELLARRDYEVVVSDIGMPQTDGIELLRDIREDSPDLPVVLVTGTPAVATALRAFEYGAFHYLAKPIETSTLLGVLRKAVHMRRFAMVGRQAAEVLGREGIPLDVQRLEASFRRALDGLWIAYQPIVRAEDGSVFGYEALLRTDEPSLPTPIALVEAAERLGRIRSVGRRVRERVTTPPPSGDTPPTLFVNLHPEDLTDPLLLDDTGTLAKVANQIVLEVTERASVDGIRDLRRATRRLREHGYRIALDDLGSGFSGLNNFALLEPDIVKVDMALVRDIHLSQTKRRLMRSIVELAHDMQIVVVAEGVETAGERETLEELECDLLQGYLFARPGPDFVIPEP